MKTSLKIDGRKCREMADECAKIVGGSAHYNLYGNRLEFEIEDAEKLVAVLMDAHNYWLRLKQRSKAIAAETVRAKVLEVIITERSRLSMS